MFGASRTDAITSFAIATLASLVLLSATAEAQPPTEVSEIRLQIGQEYEIDVRHVRSYSNSGPFDLEFRAQPPRLVARFTTGGTFTVLLMYEDGHMRRVRFVVR